MALTAAQLEQQKQQAEELLFSGPQKLGFVKALFFGHFQSRLLFPYPQLAPAERQEVDQAVAAVRQFCHDHIDAAAIDRQAEIPRSVIEGLGRLGVLGMTAPREYGGRGLGQLAYTRIMEVIGGHCASTAVFVNAHHSIGIRALLLFGTQEQKRRWLPPLVSGEKLAAFALTEPEAGSDASNVQTTATPTPDGKAFVLNGQKRWITNGGIADVLTVIARTPGQGSSAGKKKEITALLVTPDMPGFQIVNPRMAKNSIRGTATGQLAFHNMVVPAENVLGQIGKGLRIALTVLDFGRTTFGASCTGVAKACLQASTAHARQRVQFEQPLAEFELVKKKIAWMAAHAFAMEAMTTCCAAFIDRGSEDYMLETAILKVWATEALWQIVNDTMQIHGGKAFFLDQPYERWMRDARLNLVGEGANDVLRAFIAIVGIKPLADHLMPIRHALKNPLRQMGKLLQFGAQHLRDRFSSPHIHVRSAALQPLARQLACRIRDFHVAVIDQMRKYEENLLVRQYVQERLADAVSELYASSCVLSRLDSLAGERNGVAGSAACDWQVGRYFLQLSNARIRACLRALHDNLDAQTTQTADTILKQH
jgi:acyl-CoA dehydrogenase family protein 9